MKKVVASIESIPSSSQSQLPSSPAARAFFAALDEKKKDKPQRQTTRSSCSTSWIQKRIQTLGWRNRYSQEEYYPIQVTRTDPNDIGNRQETSFSVLQIQRGEIDDTYGTGATVWPAAIVLIKYLECHATTLIQNKCIVDLGTGTAITSIAAALFGASQVICTDGEPNVVNLARLNVQHARCQIQNRTANCDQKKIKSREGGENNSTERDTTALVESLSDWPVRIGNSLVDVQLYWWGTGTIQFCSDDATAGQGADQINDSPANKEPSSCDVVLVADCVLPKLYPIAPLVDAIDELLIKKDSVAILSYEHRYYPEYDPRDRFRELCRAKDLQVVSIPAEQQDPIYSVEDIEIWHVTRRC